MSIPHSVHFVEGESTENSCETPLQKLPETPKETISNKGTTDETSTAPPPQNPLRSTHRHTSKGSHAKFLYENPRFINEPIMHVLPQESSQSVGECMDWSTAGKDSMRSTISREKSGTSIEEIFGGTSSTSSFSTTCHQSSYLVPSSDSYQLTRKKAHGYSNPIIPNFAVRCREKISYCHDYNSRLDPNEPPRGKLHGNFVWSEPATGDIQGKGTGADLTETGHQLHT